MKNISILLSFLLSVTAAHANIVYVDANAAAGGDGTSWETAFNYLQDALDVTIDGRGDQVWIAQGTYYPDDGANVTEGDRLASFVIKNQVALYGGFIGVETDLAQRDWESYPTILSGEIWEDQNFWSIHVTTIGNNTYNTNFNGITITKGNANGAEGNQDSAAAVYIEQWHPAITITVTNCTFSENSASGYGGVAYYGTWIATNCTFSQNTAAHAGVASSGTWTVTNCTFLGNSASSAGVAHSGTWTATNCIFSGNSASGGGGVASSGTWTATNCTFTGNSASGGGVAYYGSWTVTNCTFSENSARNGAVASTGTWKTLNNIFYGNTGDPLFASATIYATTSTTPNPLSVISYNLIEGGISAIAGGTSYIPEAYLIDADPLFVDINDPDGPDDIWGTEDDGLRLQSGSPAIGMGDADFLPVDTYDLDGDGDNEELIPVDFAGFKRIQDTTLDLGAYEYGNVIGLSSVFTTTVGAATGGTVSTSGAIVNTQPTEITLTAAADNGYVFGYWAGNVPEELEQENPLTLTVQEDGSITAVFLQDTADTDGDGLSQYEEVIVHGTDPADPDSDNDGFDDGFEVETGYSPLNANSTPDAVSGIKTAVKYWFNAASGVSYRIEYSTDLENWFTLEDNILGAGGEIVRYYDVVASEKRFYRAKRNN
jgi:hypothetical protein